VNLADYLEPETLRRIEVAYDRAIIGKSDYYLELLKELLKDKAVAEAISRLDVDVKEFSQKVEDYLATMRSAAPPAGRIVPVGSFAELSVMEGARCAIASNHPSISPADLFCGLFASPSEALNRLFALFSVDGASARKAVIFSLAKQHLSSRSLKSVGQVRPLNSQGRAVNRAWTSQTTPLLDRYGFDFTDMADIGQVGFMVGHEKEYERLVDGLSRVEHPNVLLVGDPGIGKETLVAHLALAIAEDKVPEALFDKRIVGLDISSMIAGVGPEEAAARIRQIAREIQIAGNVILYIPELHNLLHTGGEGWISAADALMPIVSSDTFPVIAATYPREFAHDIEHRSDIVNSFEVLRMEEMSVADAEELLVFDSIILEYQYKVFITFSAVRQAVVLAARFMKPKLLPASAQELLKETVIHVGRSGGNKVGAAEVVERVSAKTNVPLRAPGKEESDELLSLENSLHERIIGQEEAVHAVSSALREYRTGLSRKNGPLASFLFVGPTGVGKTELAKALAKAHFGSEDAMIRLDMSEFQNSDGLSRFLGMADGSVDGALTARVLQKPYSLILLDEFEKANPEILNLFLQVLDDGRLTDAMSRTVDFTNCIIIATSNAHASFIVEKLRAGTVEKGFNEELKTKLTEIFKPELLNRFSRVVVFHPLAPEHMQKITALALKAVSNSLQEQGITLTFPDEVVREIGRAGFDPVFGARPLRQVISDRVKAPLSEGILKGTIARGAVVEAKVKEGSIVFE
jgi:ATP-dependent Clp protease ATP-binding subunit ClpC